MKKIQFVVLAVLSLGGGRAAHAQYTATLLTRAGYGNVGAFGVSGSNVAGWGQSLPTGLAHALLWVGGSSGVVDLQPAGFYDSQARGVFGDTEVGVAETTTTSSAMMWQGSAASAVSLNPPGVSNSLALGVSDNSEVGSGDGHAMLWHGSAQTAVDLNPAGFSFSEADAVSGSIEVGEGQDTATNRLEALMWQGTAASVVDLNPAGFSQSFAVGVSGDTEVGYGDGHALLWHGSAASVVDINPAGFSNSEALAISGNSVVGYANNDAMLWYGSATNYVDLQPFLAGLPVNIVQAEASGIDSNGDIVGIGVDINLKAYAIVWTPNSVPEPATRVLLGLGAAGLLLIGRRRR